MGKQILMTEGVVSQTSARPDHLIWVNEDDIWNNLLFRGII